MPRPASSLQHPSPQHPWLWQAPAHHSLPLPAHIADPPFMRSQVRAGVGLCSSTARTSSPPSRRPLLEVTYRVSGGHARSLAFSPPHPPFRSMRLLMPPCAIDLCAADSSWLPASLHLLVFLATFNGPNMRQVRGHGDDRRRTKALPEDLSVSPPSFSVPVCTVHVLCTQHAHTGCGPSHAANFC